MLKSQDAESAYSKATKSEMARDYDIAFRSYIKAAESFLHLSRSSATEKEKSKWKSNANRALERAERIKQLTGSVSKSGPSEESATKLSPVAIDYFSIEEQSYVLKKGGSVNGTMFPLWDQDAGHSTCQRQLKLSDLQLEMSAVWKRKDDHLMEGNPILPEDISQNIVTDCSVCASISVCIEHNKRFGSELAKSTLRAISKPMSRATLSSQGSGDDKVYDLRLYYNGGWRRIRIDGQLPFHRTSGIPLCLTCKMPDAVQGTTTDLISWPSLLEKGYMALMGGYDFPGSDSTIDLHTLTGWIPEHIDIKRPNFEPETTWTRILEGFTNGRCMSTLGTGMKHDIRWRNDALLPTHSYAVIDVREEGNERIVTVLDSWAPSDASSQQRTKVLHVPWLDALNIFDGIYLNWDPGVWPSRLIYHAVWRARRDKKSCSHQVFAKLQTNSSDPGEIWVLLTRHVNRTRIPAAFIALKVQFEDDEVGSSIVCGEQTLSNKGIYTNSPHFLVRAKIPPLKDTGHLSIFAICDDPTEDTGFTVTIYAPSPKHIQVDWEKHIPTHPFTETLEGTLTSKNSGGNHTHPTFLINPQFHLRVHRPKQATTKSRATVTLTMEAIKELPIQILVCWSQGERISEPSQKSIVASSGKYSYGLARVTTQLLPGDYSIIVSAFEPYQTGPYSLVLDSSLSFDVSTIPQEGAGMYRKTSKGSWDDASAAGAPSFNRYAQNPVFELSLSAQAQVQIRLQLLRPSHNVSMNITIYPATESLSSDRHVATSGAYDDAMTGVVTPLTSLAKGRYWVVPSTYNPGVRTGFQLIAYSTLASTTLSPRPS